MKASAQAPSPSKDYVYIEVTKKEVILRQWKINPQCLKPGVLVSPTDDRDTHEDFLSDKNIQGEIKRVFGKPTLQYIKQLCKGQVDILPRLSKTLQIYIASFLELEDIASLAQCNKHFRELCSDEKLWEHIVERSIGTITPDLRFFAQDVGWREVFFTNKMQLQRQLRKLKV